MVLTVYRGHDMVFLVTETEGAHSNTAGHIPGRVRGIRYVFRIRKSFNTETAGGSDMPAVSSRTADHMSVLKGDGS
jgi:hypothetical protein